MQDIGKRGRWGPSGNWPTGLWGLGATLTSRDVSSQKESSDCACTWCCWVGRWGDEEEKEEKRGEAEHSTKPTNNPIWFSGEENSKYRRLFLKCASKRCKTNYNWVIFLGIQLVRFGTLLDLLFIPDSNSSQLNVWQTGISVNWNTKGWMILWSCLNDENDKTLPLMYVCFCVH